ISKTRDQWEISTQTTEGGLTSLRMNTQRDVAASEFEPLTARPRLARERLFGSIAALLNNELIRGQSVRLNCEWVADNVGFYIVQIDQEDEDFKGLNPYQLRIPPVHTPQSTSGRFLKAADRTAVRGWDKLKVLEDLWDDSWEHQPQLFYVP